LISGATGAGTEELKQAVMRYLDEHPRAPTVPEAGDASEGPAAPTPSALAAARSTHDA
jgi:hypothetical protein